MIWLFCVVKVIVNVKVNYLLSGYHKKQKINLFNYMIIILCCKGKLGKLKYDTYKLVITKIYKINLFNQIIIILCCKSNSKCKFVV